MKIVRILALIHLLFYPYTSLFADDDQRTPILNRGSDSMAIAVVEWAEQYRHHNKAAGIAVSGGGAPLPVLLPFLMARLMLPMLVGR